MSRPLRREVRLPIYWLVVGLAVMLVSPLLSIFASVSIANTNRVQAEHAAALAAEQTRAEGRKKACELFGSQMDVYLEEPPTTDTGRKAQQNWIDLYQINNCQPARTK